MIGTLEAPYDHIRLKIHRAGFGSPAADGFLKLVDGGVKDKGQLIERPAPMLGDQNLKLRRLALLLAGEPIRFQADFLAEHHAVRDFLDGARRFEMVELEFAFILIDGSAELGADKENQMFFFGERFEISQVVGNRIRSVHPFGEELVLKVIDDDEFR